MTRGVKLHMYRLFQMGADTNGIFIFVDCECLLLTVMLMLIIDNRKMEAHITLDVDILNDVE